MARFKDIDGVRTGNLFRVDPTRIKEDPGFNIRIEDDDYEQRLESYTTMYLAGSEPPPLKVYLRGDEIIVVDGHVRRRAALRAIERGAQIKDVPVVQFTGNDADRVAAMLQSGQGRGWTPIELLMGYKRLTAFGWTEKQIAEQVGKTEQHVRDIMALASADTSIQKMIKNGQVSASLAIEVVRQDDHLATATLTAAVEKAKAEGKTRATAKHVTAVRGGASGRDVNRALRDLLNEIRRQVEQSGVTDEDFDDHVFHIEGRFLKTLQMSR
ncbi:MAG: hypothetical protein F8N36_14380 [Desulfovibrio sp.]|uniref:ParB/RepB/Spo0J family partition protein n=1 Tax=Desulfovibrio sp. TaxID=885 RepID=UPI00135DBADE|nr:hypothetical protein [Desulfovibrio sp.]MTJ94025.1 hypothetical protein [Desulfovibrio sp.]